MNTPYKHYEPYGITDLTGLTRITSGPVGKGGKGVRMSVRDGHRVQMRAGWSNAFSIGPLKCGIGQVHYARAHARGAHHD